MLTTEIFLRIKFRHSRTTQSFKNEEVQLGYTYVLGVTLVRGNLSKSGQEIKFSDNPVR